MKRTGKWVTVMTIVSVISVMVGFLMMTSYAAMPDTPADVTFTPVAWVYLPLIEKSPTRLQDGYYKFTFDYGSFWFTVTDGGTKAINGGYDFQRPYCARAKRDFTKPAMMNADGTFYFGASTPEGDPLAYLDVTVILSPSEAFGRVEDYVLGTSGPYYCGYVSGIAVKQ